MSEACTDLLKSCQEVFLTSDTIREIVHVSENYKTQILVVLKLCSIKHVKYDYLWDMEYRV